MNTAVGFVLGGTEKTASSIIEGLLEAETYVRRGTHVLKNHALTSLPLFMENIVVGVRPTSLSKPEVSKLREIGVDIRAVELSNSSDELDAAWTNLSLPRLSQRSTSKCIWQMQQNELA